MGRLGGRSHWQTGMSPVEMLSCEMAGLHYRLTHIVIKKDTCTSNILVYIKTCKYIYVCPFFKLRASTFS